jgi:hypothetical protein
MPSTLLPRYEYDPGTGLVQIDFSEPLADDDKFHPRYRLRDVFGGTGIRQRNTDYRESLVVLEHEFVPEPEMDQVITMIQVHVGEGGTFDYVPDRIGAPGAKITLEWLDDELDMDRQFVQRNLFRFRMPVRKVIA